MTNEQKLSCIMAVFFVTYLIGVVWSEPLLSAYKAMLAACK